MLKKLILIGILIWAFYAKAQTLSNQYQHINTPWVAPATVYPNCTTTLTSLPCLHDYTLTYTPPQSGSPVNVTVLSGTNTYNWTPGGYLQCGNWQVGLVANYYDVGSTSTTPKLIPALVLHSPVYVPCPTPAVAASALNPTPAP